MSSCVNDPNAFCFICGEFVIPKNRRSFSDILKRKYEACYGISVKKFNKILSPESLCSYCVSCLHKWEKRK